MPRAVAAGVSLVLLVGCGTTISTSAFPPDEQHAPAIPVDIADGGSNSPGSTGSISDRSDVGPADVGGDADGFPDLTGAQGRDPAIAPSQPQLSNGPGVSATTVKIGIVHATNVDSVDNAVSGGNQRTGSDRDNYDVLIAELNKRGGIAGRRLVPVYLADDSQSEQTRAQKEQGACARFTQDERVFAVLAYLVTDTLRTCLQRAGVVLISEFYTYSQRLTFQRFSNYYEPGSLPVDRLAAALGELLPQQGFLQKWDPATGQPGSTPVRVGILTLDDPGFAAAVTNDLLPRLRQLRIPAEVVAVPPASRTSDAGATTASVSSAVLRFRSNGVSHVIFLTAAALAPLSFMTTAEQQQYRPRYAYSSQELMPSALAAGAVSNPDGQLAGSLGLGFWPVFDLSSRENPYRKSNPTWSKCLKTMSAAKRSISGQQEPFLVITCDRLEFLLASTHELRTLNALTFRNAVSRLGTSYVSAFALRAAFMGSSRSGPVSVRTMQYGSDCDCFTYAGPELSVPR